MGLKIVRTDKDGKIIRKKSDPDKEEKKRNRMKYWGGFLIAVLNGLTYPLGVKVFVMFDPIWQIFLIGAWLAFAEAMTYEIISRLGAPTREMKKQVADATAISMDSSAQKQAISKPQAENAKFRDDMMKGEWETQTVNDNTKLYNSMEEYENGKETPKESAKESGKKGREISSEELAKEVAEESSEEEFEAYKQVDNSV